MQLLPITEIEADGGRVRRGRRRTFLFYGRMGSVPNQQVVEAVEDAAAFAQKDIVAQYGESKLYDQQLSTKTAPFHPALSVFTQPRAGTTA